MTGQAPPEAASQVWPFEGHPGFRRSIDVACTVAAPLLAGFSFTLLVLLLPTFADETTTVEVGRDVRVIRDSHPFSAVPELAAILLLLAGLLLIGTVQAGIAARYHSHSPADLADWYPQFFPEGDNAAGTGPDGAALPGWSDTDGWQAVHVGSKWFGAWPRKYLHDEIVTANKWASTARNLYHLGIMALLSGIVALVIPPPGQGTAWRVALAIVAGVGVVLEAIWIGWTMVSR